MSTEKQILDWLASQKDAMIAELERMVNIDGGSYDKAGVDAVGQQIKTFLEGHGIAVETIPQKRFGDCLRATVEADASSTTANSGNLQKNILLMGHRDTVFPKGEPTRRPFTIKDGRAYGPGVVDMKGGLVQNMFVLAAFKKFGGAPGPVQCLFTADEEVGSPEGAPVIAEHARHARVVFNSEPGRVNGGVVTRRKGGVFMIFDIVGKAAHSGGAFEKGISAIGELAHKIVAIHALTDLSRGITLNVGLVSGGQSVNTVAPSAQGQIDFRYQHPEDRDVIMAKINTILNTSYVPGTTTSLTIRGEFKPVHQNDGTERMFALYKEAAAETGFSVTPEFTGGGADSGITVAMGAPTLCATGPVGGGAHSPEEYLEVDTIIPRAQAMARAILKLEAAGF